ncbi:MAG: LptF/LptG family permease [Myxococcota bacterium]
MKGLALIRYVAVAYLGAILLTTMGLTILVVAASMIEGGGQLTQAGAGVGTVLKLAAFNGLSFSYQILPAASFLGALIAGTMLARRGELLGVQASGIGPGPVWTGFFVVAVLTAVVGYGLGEWVVPRAVTALEQTRQTELEGRTDNLSRFYSRRLRWFRIGDRILYLPQPAEIGSTVFSAPSVYQIEDGVMTLLTDAERLSYVDSGWQLEEASVFDAETGEVTEHPTLPIELDMTAQDIIEVSGDPRMMGVPAIRALIERRERAGFDVTSHQIELNTRFAYPLNAIWMLAIALPWALHPDRRRSLAVNLGAGVVVIAVLFVVTYFFRLLALSHTIPVPLGAYGIFSVCLLLAPLSAWSYRRYRVRGSVF